MSDDVEKVAGRLQAIYEDWCERRDKGEWTLLDGSGWDVKQAVALLRSQAERIRELEVDSSLLESAYLALDDEPSPSDIAFVRRALRTVLSRVAGEQSS